MEPLLKKKKKEIIWFIINYINSKYNIYIEINIKIKWKKKLLKKDRIIGKINNGYFIYSNL